MFKPLVAAATLACVFMPAPLAAQAVAVQSGVYQERSENGTRTIAPITRLSAGDKVVTILTWHAPRGGSYTVVSAVPRHLAVESTSHDGLEVSTDGGRSWRRLADADAVPPGTTHLRWQMRGGEGRLSYRSIVR
ncbi:MAG: hypothetical protein ABIT16_12895 [Croceibacterium sp.]